MKFGLIYIFVLIWTITSAILCLSGVGQFAEWQITALPWHWSCFCVLYWHLILSGVLIAASVLVGFYYELKKERTINQYPPEQRDFIRRAMDYRKRSR